MLTRCHIPRHSEIPGYDELQQVSDHSSEPVVRSFTPHPAYDAYLRIHKVFVGPDGGRYLEDLGTQLENETMPQYLNAAGWALAESALVQSEHPATERISLLSRAESCWKQALENQDEINNSAELEWMCDNSAPYRLALDLAFTPLMKALVVGNITEAVREQVFASTLAIAQASLVQCNLALRSRQGEAASDHLGFEHECNALLSLLYLNDPRYVPIPSPARAGTGYDYPDQTHDIVVINQHWGTILKAIPVEIKAKASRRDVKRYKALIVRGKMHLTVTGKHLPENTISAFTRIYENNGDEEDKRIAAHASLTLRHLLQLYQKGDIVTVLDTPTKFHSHGHVAQDYPELSLNRTPGIH